MQLSPMRVGLFRAASVASYVLPSATAFLFLRAFVIRNAHRRAWTGRTCLIAAALCVSATLIGALLGQAAPDTPLLYSFAVLLLPALAGVVLIATGAGLVFGGRHLT